MYSVSCSIDSITLITNKEKHVCDKQNDNKILYDEYQITYSITYNNEDFNNSFFYLIHPSKSIHQ